MDSVIDLTNETIKQAYHHAIRKVILNKNEEAELYFRLNFINKSTAIPALLPLVFINHKKLAKIVADVIYKIVAKLPITSLISLDKIFRGSDNTYNDFWKKITVNLIGNLNFSRPVCNTIYALLCSHHNGYIREQAVKLLIPEFLSLNIPVLLIRVNDWVNPIKHLASIKLIEIMNANKINDFIPSLNLITGLYHKKRYDHSLLIGAIENQLIEKCYDELLALMNSSDKIISQNAIQIIDKTINSIRSSDQILLSQ